MSCWSVLDLPADADKRSIKRQYAVLLKRHRPDEDPEGFQRLREAYEQALEWADWQQQEPPPQAETQTPSHPPVAADWLGELDFPQAPLEPATPHIDQGPSPAQRLAEQCLEAVSVQNFEERLAQARLYDCEREFELALLWLCQNHDDQPELTDKAIAHFRWLTAWQREDLPPFALETLRNRLMERAWSQLAEATEDNARFVELAKHLESAPWLQTLDDHRWLNERLAMALAHAPRWSQNLFDEVCSLRGWKQSGHTPCPEPWWSQLLRRSDAQTFLEHQRLLAQKADANESRAARMLFMPLSDNARVQLSISFKSADWNACEALYQTVQVRYPDLLNQLPQLNPEVWRPLRREPPTMAVPVAILVTAASTTWVLDYQLGADFYTSMMSMLIRVVMLAVIACVLAWFGNVLGRGTWRLDNWLNKALGKWLSVRRPAPLPIRESLWVWLLGGFIFLYGGLLGLGTYVGTLAFMALGARPAFSARFAPLLTRIRGGVGGEILLGAFMGALVPAVLLAAALARHSPLPANQGMQAWPQRVCAVQQQTAEPCPAGYSQSQWYPLDARQEARP